MKCSARRTNGEPCKAKAIQGGTVCRVHGGSAPQVKAKARQRLLEAADPAAARLVEIALNGSDLRVAVTALRDLLDRAGLSEPKQIQVSLSDAVLDEEIARLKAELGEE